MAERTTKYFQQCDFCHKELEVSSGGLDSITLPGRYVDTDGCQTKQWIKADICPECKERLREYVGRQCHLGKSITRNEKHCGIVQMAWYGDCRVRLQEFAAFRMASIDYLSVLPCHGAGNYRLMAQEAGIQHQGTQSIILQDDRPSEP